MRKIFLIGSSLIFLISCKTTNFEEVVFSQSQQFQLSKPMVEVDSNFFQNSAKLNISMDHPNVEIRYAYDLDEVKRNSLKYTEPLVISSSKVIHIKAFHSDFIESETVSVDLIKMNTLAADAKISVRPDAKKPYNTKGIGILTDFQKGSLQFKDGNWLGFQSDTISLDLNFQKEEKIKSVGLSFLKDHASWIFLPHVVELWVSGKRICRKEFNAPAQEAKPELKIERLLFTVEKTNHVTIKIINLASIPDWHSGKGMRPWLFLDEVFLNI